MKTNNTNNNFNNILAILALVIVVVAFFNLFITFTKVNDFNKALTGYATAYVNITINKITAVSINPSSINWGNGSINGSMGNNATLETRGNNSYVYGGNWSNATITGLVIANLGTSNATLNVSNTYNGSDFFGTGASPRNYSWNFTNYDALACSGGAYNSVAGTWIATNKTTYTICSQFNFQPSVNRLWLNVRLVVPTDSNATTYFDSPLADTITVTAVAN